MSHLEVNKSNNIDDLKVVKFRHRINGVRSLNPKNIISIEKYGVALCCLY